MIENTATVPVAVEIEKKNNESPAKPVPNAKFKIVYSQRPFAGETAKQNTLTLETGPDGKITIDESEKAGYDPTQKVQVTIEETSAPEHKVIEGKIQFTLKWNYTSRYEWDRWIIDTDPTLPTLVSGESISINYGTNTDHLIKINVTDIKLVPAKVDIGGSTTGKGKHNQFNEPLKDIPFTVTFKQGSGATEKIETRTITTNENGEATTGSVGGFDPAKELTIVLKEQTPPTQYKPLVGTATVVMKYNTTTGKWVVKSGTATSGQFTNGEKWSFKVDGNGDLVFDDIENIELVPARVDIGGDVTGEGKHNQFGEPLSGAKFKVTFKQTGMIPDKTKEITTNTNGEATTGNIAGFDPTKDLTIVLQELTPPADCKPLVGTATVVMKYDTPTKKWVLKSGGTDASGAFTNGEKWHFKYDASKMIFDDIENFELVPVNLNLVKTDNDSVGTKSRLANAKFEVKFEQGSGVAAITETKTITTNANGEATTGDVGKFDPTATIKVTITEQTAPENYEKIEPISFDLKYDLRGTNTWKATPASGTVPSNDPKGTKWTIDNATLKIEIEDPFKIEKLSFYKKNSQTGAPVSDARFNITITNVKSIDSITGYAGNKTPDSSNVVTIPDTPLEGLVINKMVLLDRGKPTVITLEETFAPTGYKKIQGVMTITITKEGTNSFAVSGTAPEAVTGEFDVRKKGTNEIEILLKDIPWINLGGKVWLDGNEGVKPVVTPNGKIGSGESPIQNVKVRLYTVDTITHADGTKKVQKSRGKDIYDTATKQVMYNLDGEALNNVVTNAEGKYFFGKLENANDYYIVFEYDGINYETTIKVDPKANDTSHVDEIARNAFNAKFKTIQPGKTEEGTVLPYDTAVKENEAILKTTTPLTKKVENTLVMGAVNPGFEMKAKTGNYIDMTRWLSTWNDPNSEYLNINMGLVGRGVDLSLSKDILEARVSINDRTEYYPYALIKEKNGKLTIDGATGKLVVENEAGKPNSHSLVQYDPLLLYLSDYNYKIDDYFPGGIKNDVNAEDNNPSIAPKIKNGAKELSVEVDYEIALNNHSTHEGVRVNKIVDYYDQKYTLKAIEYGEMVIDGDIHYSKIRDIAVPTKTTATIDGKTYDKVEIDLKGAATTGKNLGQGGQQLVRLTFEVKGEGNAINITQEYDNIAEILEYSTDEGWVDKNSAPGNAIDASNKLRYEDDTDHAPGFEMDTYTEERTMTGNVWKDAMETTGEGYIHGKGDYIPTEGNQINDVVVQLIEIRKEPGIDRQFEYIWQETRTGSNKVKTMLNDGSGLTGYTHPSVVNPGEYRFTEFIPGDYIIRFIYGDGRYVNVVPSGTERDKYKDNIKTYNGQDYKSTIEKADRYQRETIDYWNDGVTRKNDARDNEARRLTAMEQFVAIDESIGQTLRDKTNLEKTWMCAETSKMVLLIERDGKEVERNSEHPEQFNINKYEVNNVDFGLAERPVTKLELEKHIKSLAVSKPGEGYILNTKDDMYDKYGGLGRIPNTGIGDRTDRGIWWYAIDLDLLQGASLEVDYQYTVKNAGDTDYISTDLADKYKDKTISVYKQALKDESAYVKGEVQNGAYGGRLGKYLGTAYYTGTPGANDAKVGSRVETIVDALNKEIKFNMSTEDYVDFTTEGMSKNVPAKYIEDYGGTYAPKAITVETILQSKKSTSTLVPTEKDNTKSLLLKGTLTSLNTDGLTYDSYIAQVAKYSNAVGRDDTEAVPANPAYASTYVNIEGGNIQLTPPEPPRQIDGGATYEFEHDEYWAERIRVTSPTGGTDPEEKIEKTMTPIIITAISSITVVGLGILGIKKFVLKK